VKTGMEPLALFPFFLRSFLTRINRKSFLATEAAENTEETIRILVFINYFLAFLCALCVPAYTNLHLCQNILAVLGKILFFSY
jgi:hypothetical protein